MGAVARIPRSILRLVLPALLLACAGTSPATSPATPRKSLIEFGWDEPDPHFMRTHMDSLQATPFDGCVFRLLYKRPDGTDGNFSWDLWSRRRFTAAEVEPFRQDLLATPFGRFRQCFLRVNVTPGDLDWFEDHSAVMANLELAARIAREAGLPGILFDTEAYKGKLWSYAEQTKRHPYTWDSLATQVRHRGAETMRAFERGYPGLTVFCTEAYSRPLRDTEDRKLPLRDVQNGLLAPFLDGMASAASPKAVIVDGHEMSFGFRQPGQYAAKSDTMRNAFRRLSAVPDLYRSRLSVGFGVWMDIEKDGRNWHPDDPAANYFTPQTFGAAVQAALDHADRYVWVYTQKAKWWGPHGRENLPAVYDSVLRSVRR